MKNIRLSAGILFITCIITSQSILANNIASLAYIDKSNKQEISFFTKNNKRMLPLRQLAFILNLQLFYNKEKHEAILKDEKKEIVFNLDTTKKDKIGKNIEFIMKDSSMYIGLEDLCNFFQLDIINKEKNILIVPKNIIYPTYEQISLIDLELDKDFQLEKSLILDLANTIIVNNGIFNSSKERLLSYSNYPKGLFKASNVEINEILSNIEKVKANYCFSDQGKELLEEITDFFTQLKTINQKIYENYKKNISTKKELTTLENLFENIVFKAREYEKLYK